MARLTNKELIDHALDDAADWQNDVADAYRHMRDSDEYKEALQLMRMYRRLLKKRQEQRK
jgi:hypothetical protein